MKGKLGLLLAAFLCGCGNDHETPVAVEEEERGVRFLDVTAASRFRSPGDIAPEWLYPWDLIERGDAVVAQRPWRDTGYVKLMDSRLATRAQLRWLGLKRPAFAQLNDGFGPRPPRATEELIRRWLERRFPEPSRWERSG